MRRGQVNTSIVLGIAGAVLAVACADDPGGDGSGGGGDAGSVGPVDSGVHMPAPDAMPDAQTDGGVVVRPDAGAPDSGRVFDYGTRLASVPADIIGISDDESEVFYIKDRKIMSVAPEGGAAREILDAPSYATYAPFGSTVGAGTGGESPVLWVISNIQNIGGLSGKVRAYRASNDTLVTLTGTSARSIIRLSDDREWAIATDAFQVIGSGNTSTRTADFVLVNADGTQRATIVPRANLGMWNAQDNVYAGRCRWSAAFTSSTSAVLAACAEDAEERTLWAIDLPSGRTSSIAVGVTTFLLPNPAGTFFLWQDNSGRVFASRADGTGTELVDDPEGFDGVRMLDARRFAYNTLNQRLKVASWPALQPVVIQPIGVENIRAASNDGRYLLFGQSDDFLSQLFIIPTATDTPPMFAILESQGLSYPGDDAFSADASRVFWYEMTNPNGIGDIHTRPVGALSGKTELTRQAYWVFNYANPDRVLLMVNARESGRIFTTDIATRALDASDELQILAGDVASNSYEFAIFPRTRRIVYEVPTGPNAGIWVRDLP